MQLQTPLGQTGPTAGVGGLCPFAEKVRFLLWSLRKLWYISPVTISIGTEYTPTCVLFFIGLNH
jgi:hypothetical protein